MKNRNKKYSTQWDHEYWMKSNGMFCGLNTPKALKSKEGKGEELAQRLPPYAKRKSLLVDKFPACPQNWMRSAGTLASYLTPVQEGQGMWLDFNKNSEHTHEVAIVVSVQGVNPLTGLPCDDQYLEQYVENCPKCKEAFKPERLCEKCGFKYPKQNYISTTGTPTGELWLDGFRAINGAVRQYIITTEKMRGVASNVVGNDRVFAIGLSFFLSKDKKKEKEVLSYTSLDFSWSAPLGGYNPIDCVGASNPVKYTTTTTCDPSLLISGSSASCSSTGSKSSSSIMGSRGKGKSKKRSSGKRLGKSKGIDIPEEHILYSATDVKSVETSQLEVGAGAKINQLVYDDPEQLDFWRDTPEATICINYCLEEEATKIIEAGEISLEGHQEGFLQGLPVGN